MKKLNNLHFFVDLKNIVCYHICIGDNVEQVQIKELRKILVDELMLCDEEDKNINLLLLVLQYVLY